MTRTDTVRNGSQRESDAEVGDERGGHDEFAERPQREPRLHQDRVDDGQRRRRQRDAGDLGSRSRPAQHPGAERPGADEGRDERHATDQKTFGELLAHDAGINLGPGQEGQ